MLAAQHSVGGVVLVLQRQLQVSPYKIYRQVQQALCSEFVGKIFQLSSDALQCKLGLSKDRCASVLWLQHCGMLGAHLGDQRRAFGEAWVSR